MSSSWPSIADNVCSPEISAATALLGVPLGAGSVTPGACDRAPALVRSTLKRISRYDIETGKDVQARIADLGDVELDGLDVDQATDPIREAVGAAVRNYAMTLLIGGNNAITRPAVLGLGRDLGEVGLITLDAHLDMRDTDEGLSNGNPVRALLEDGLPGTNIAQIGLAAFANTPIMHRDARNAGNLILTMRDVREQGIGCAVERALAHVAHCKALVVDCDIDVIDRAQLPGAPGARPGGMAVTDFFAAARLLAADERVNVMDLTELDPSLDPTDLTALTAARWVAECMQGLQVRPWGKEYS